MTVTRIIMANRPVGVPTIDDFARQAVELDALRDGEILFRPSFFSLDPYLRLRMAARHLSGNLQPGDVMMSEAVGIVEETASPLFSKGQMLAGFAPWQELSVCEAAEFRALEGFDGLSPSLALGTLGMPGLTAYAGVTRLLKPTADDIVVVSAASGPVGGAVGQLARARGARVIGIAGGREKCDWVTRVAGFDACIDHRAGSVRDQLAAICPEGPTAYFDNVGGQLLRDMLASLRIGGRVVLCGIIDDYNADEPGPGPNPMEIMAARATVYGLVVYDHEDLRETMIAEIGAMIRTGDFACREDVSEGLASAPEALARLLRGENQGKALVRI